jgi:hypothetical protein
MAGLRVREGKHRTRTARRARRARTGRRVPQSGRRPVLRHRHGIPGVGPAVRGPASPGAASLQGVGGTRHRAVATPGDLLNLLGFVDGTENPVGRAAAGAAITGDEDPVFRGGSHTIVQKVTDRRSKLTDIELDVPGSHKDVNTVTGPDGEELEIAWAARNPAPTRYSTVPRPSPEPSSSCPLPLSWSRYRSGPPRAEPVEDRRAARARGGGGPYPATAAECSGGDEKLRSPLPRAPRPAA